jgi:hypothetical protein
MAALLGRPVEELLAMSADEVRALVHANDGAVVQRRMMSLAPGSGAAVRAG